MKIKSTKNVQFFGSSLNLYHANPMFVKLSVKNNFKFYICKTE